MQIECPARLARSLRCTPRRRHRGSSIARWGRDRSTCTVCAATWAHEASTRASALIAIATIHRPATPLGSAGSAIRPWRSGPNDRNYTEHDDAGAAPSATINPGTSPITTTPGTGSTNPSGGRRKPALRSPAQSGAAPVISSSIARDRSMHGPIGRRRDPRGSRHVEQAERVVGTDLCRCSLGRVGLGRSSRRVGGSRVLAARLELVRQRVDRRGRRRRMAGGKRGRESCAEDKRVRVA